MGSREHFRQWRRTLLALIVVVVTAAAQTADAADVTLTTTAPIRRDTTTSVEASLNVQVDDDGTYRVSVWADSTTGWSCWQRGSTDNLSIWSNLSLAAGTTYPPYLFDIHMTATATTQGRINVTITRTDQGNEPILSRSILLVRDRNSVDDVAPHTSGV